MSNSPKSRLAASIACSLFSSICLASFGAEPYRRAPKFEGKLIPDPPSQGQPWTPPASTLPKFLMTSFATLFEQGLSDPRGCEYRRVEIGDWAIQKTRGFVLPERAEIPGRFVICWDGLVYPALTVGEPLDLEKDIRELAESIKRGREASAKPDLSYRQGLNWGFAREPQSIFGDSGVNDRSPIKLGLLLRLGRADLAEALFASGTTWTPEPRARDLTDYGISYLTLANDRAASAFVRLSNAHVRADDVIALDMARRLAKFRTLAEARADFLGFPKSNNQGRMVAATAGRFSFLGQLDQLLADHERRAKMPPRGPIPKKGGDPSARIAALIRDLDQIDEQQMMSPGMAQPGSSWLVKQLIEEGDPAVGPLLEVFESDNRLTRSVTLDRGGWLGRYFHPVHEAALAGLIGILQTREFDDQRFSMRNADPDARRALAGSIRQFWEKTRAIPLVDRWYRTLLDDSAGTDRWLEAASAIVAPVDAARLAKPPAGEPPNPMKGEALRLGREPTITDLMIRRVRDIVRSGNPSSSIDIGLHRACSMALTLNRWDERASLPILKDLMTTCRSRVSDRLGAASQFQPDQGLLSSIAQFTQIRAKLGDSEALDEYAEWVRTTTPKMLEHNTMEVFRPLLIDPARPSIAAATRWLFNDPKSPWVPLTSTPSVPGLFPADSLLSSNLVVLPGFREALIAGLSDRSPLGTIQKDSRGALQVALKGGRTTNTGASLAELDEVPADRAVEFRACDYVAWKLGSLEGSPRCEPYWPEARRDEAVARCLEYLKRFGDRFTTEAPPNTSDFPYAKAHLRFPVLGRPATAEDVAALRAIFTLEGQGETRLVPLPGFPLKASWVTLKDSPVDKFRSPDNVRIRGFNTEGWVWQAEEVRKGDTWERHYGFVGNHTIGRAPASEIEFIGEGYLWGYYEGGLSGLAKMGNNGPNAYQAGQPIPVTLLIRNRLGVVRSSPTEFLKPGADGKPELRRGVNLALTFSPFAPIGSSRSVNGIGGEVEPRRTAHFDPGDGSRSLATLESFEALRIDVNDWFDASQPGRYQLRFKFAADSGVGEGYTGAAYFSVGDE